jgi:signal peptidase I
MPASPAQPAGVQQTDAAAQPVVTIQSTQPAQPAPAVQYPPLAAEPPLIVQSDTPLAKQPSSAKRRQQKRRRHSQASAKKLFLIALRDVLIALILLAIMLQFFTPTIVREHSMENTLKENEILYIAKKAYWFGSPGYGDIVVFRSLLTDKNGSEKSLVKRVIGLPGDRIFISGGTVFRNGEPLSEPYLKSGLTPGDMGEVMVPANSYFVLGDNREVSNDSRNSAVGFVDKSQLQGKVVLRILPLNEFQTF